VLTLEKTPFSILCNLSACAVTSLLLVGCGSSGSGSGSDVELVDDSALQRQIEHVEADDLTGVWLVLYDESGTSTLEDRDRNYEFSSSTKHSNVVRIFQESIDTISVKRCRGGGSSVYHLDQGLSSFTVPVGFDELLTSNVDVVVSIVNNRELSAGRFYVNENRSDWQGHYVSNEVYSNYRAYKVRSDVSSPIGEVNAAGKEFDVYCLEYTESSGTTYLEDDSGGYRSSSVVSRVRAEDESNTIDFYQEDRTDNGVEGYVDLYSDLTSENFSGSTSGFGDMTLPNVIRTSNGLSYSASSMDTASGDLYELKSDLL